MIESAAKTATMRHESARRFAHLLIGAVIASSILVATAARAQTAEPAPLFASDGIVSLTLRLPLRTVMSRRRGRPRLEGFAIYTEPNGDTIERAVEITTRGKSRLRVCSFPPLRLDFERSTLEGTLFEGQSRLKLVTHCRNQSSFEQYLRVEYLIYRIYEQISDVAYRVRLLRMRYIDSERDGRVTEAPAFLIESAAGLAARTGFTIAEVPAVPAEDVDLSELAMLTLFQFLIGNTDYSAIAPAEGEDCCHNSDIFLRDDGKLIAVPYDFDQAGLVDASYALPDEQFGIRSVRERVYRGTCATMPYLDETIARVNAARPRIDALVTSAGLDDDTREYVTEYLEIGFGILNTPELRQREMLSKCTRE